MIWMKIWGVEPMREDLSPYTRPPEDRLSSSLPPPHAYWDAKLNNSHLQETDHSQEKIWLWHCALGDLHICCWSLKTYSLFIALAVFQCAEKMFYMSHGERYFLLQQNTVLYYQKRAAAGSACFPQGQWVLPQLMRKPIILTSVIWSLYDHNKESREVKNRPDLDFKVT